jgi:hypothetical protein
LIAAGTAGTLLHILAPWLVASGCAASVPIYGVSGLLLLASYTWMSLVPLWEMWRR